MLHALQARRVDRAFAARPRPGSIRSMRAHLAGCAACRRRYERHLVLEAALPGGADRAGERLWQEIRAVAQADGDRGEGAAPAAHHHADPEPHDADPGARGGVGRGLPFAADLGEKARARRAVLAEDLRAAVAVVTDG